MKNKSYFYCLLLLLTAISIVSCEKYQAEDDFSPNVSNSTLVVRACMPKAVNTESQENLKVSYPVKVYVFDKNDICINLSEISTADDELILKLAEGTYDIYAIAGANDESYELPTQENATKESIIKLKDGYNHGDLMSAYSNVVLVDGEENTLTLSLERKVMLLENVTMTNIPNDVTAVSVSISPLYENLLLDGTYSGENGTFTINLSKEGDSDVWTNNSEIYVLEAANKATLKVSMTRNDEIKSYSYSCAEDLKANYKININGFYESNGFNVSGTIKGVEWAGTINVDFTFKDEQTSDKDEQTSEPTSLAPEVGTLYQDCFVMKSEKSGSKTLVTLFTTAHKNRLEYIKGDQESMKEAVDAGIAELAVEGIEGWRLASVEEFRYIRENAEFINGKLEEYGKDIFNIARVDTYFCLDATDGKIKIYCLYRDDLESSPSSGLASAYLYAFTTIEF